MAEVTIRTNVEGMDEAVRAFEELGNQLERLEKQLATTSEEGGQSAKSLSDMGKSVAFLDGVFESMAKELDAFKTKMAEGGKEAGLTGEQMEKMSSGVKALESQLTKMRERLDTVRAGMKETTDGGRKQDDAFSGINSALSGMLLRYVGVTAVLGGFVSALYSSFRLAMDAREATVWLNATLEATGHAAGLTAGQLEQMSERLRQATTLDTTGIQRAMSVLLTFSSVHGETFERAISLSADLAAMFGMDLTTATRMLGRALESPAQSLGMLTRYIGRLQPEQERSIKLFMEQGRVAEAQGVILEVLTSKVGGLAAKLGTDMPGSIAKFTRAWKDLEQSLGLESFTTKKLDIVTGWIDFVTGKLRSSTQDLVAEQLAADREIIASSWASAEEKIRAQGRMDALLAMSRRDAEAALAKEIEVAMAASDQTEQARRANIEETAAKEFQLRMAAIDNEIEVGQRTLTEKRFQIEARLAMVRDGTLEERSEAEKLRGMLAAIDAQLLAQRRARVDYEVAIGKKGLEDQLAFIERELASGRHKEEVLIQLLMQRQQKQQEIYERNSKNAALYAQVVTATIQEQIDVGEEYVTMWGEMGDRIQVTRKEYDAFIAKQKELEDAADPLREFRKEVELLNKMFELNLISQEAFNKGMETAAEKLDTASKKADAWTDWQKEMLRVTQGFGREFTDLIVKTLEGSQTAWKDFRDSLIRMFNRAIIDQFITKPLEDALNDMIKMIKEKMKEAEGAGGGLWGMLTNVAMTYFTGGGGGGGGTAAAGGGSAAYVDVGSPTVTPLQHGGVLPRGFVGMVGEAGPELVVPSSSSRVIPNDQLTSGSQQVVINQTFQAGVSRAELASLLPQLRADVLAGVLEAKRRGGVFGRAF